MEIATYLRIRHRDISNVQRQLLRRIAKIPDIWQNQYDLKDFPFPDADTQPIPYLSSPQIDGLECRKCTLPARCAQCGSLYHEIQCAKLNMYAVSNGVGECRGTTNQESENHSMTRAGAEGAMRKQVECKIVGLGR
jgi:hypothetical protein